MKSLSLVRLFATPWTVAHQAPPFMGFSRKGYWSGFPFPSSGDLPNPGTEPESPTLQADSLPSEPPGKPKLCLEEFVFGLSFVTLFLYLQEKDGVLQAGLILSPREAGR